MSTNLLPSSQPIVYAIDASSANKKNRTGVEMYAFHLIQNMKKHALAENERVVLYSPTKLEGVLADLPQGWESRVLSWSLPFGWMKGRVSWELFRTKPNVFFVPAQGLPLRVFSPLYKGGARGGSQNASGRGVRFVTTIHDIGFRRLPQVYFSADRRRLERVTKQSIHKAKQLLTVSEFSRQEIQSFYQVPSERVTVTPLAADTETYKRLSPSEIEPVLQSHRLGKHFFLYVGRLDKKKNIETIIRAFNQFKADRGIGDPYELVLVGSPGFGFASMKTWIDGSPSKDQIHVLGYLEEGEISALMNAATAFLFPSWYEGFGIPNLEAMSCGTPLLISDIPAHHEVVGGAAVFVSPQDPEPWVRAMKQLVEDPSLREQLIQKGSLRSSLYDWKKTAEKTWEVLQGVLK